MKINERITELRKNNNLTQEQIAKIIDDSQSGYSKIERGEKQLNIVALIKLAEIYNTSTDYILGISNKDNNNDKINKIIEYCQKIKTEI